MAYVNKSINENGWGSFVAAATILLYQRLKFVTPASGDGKAKVDVCAIGDRADLVAMTPSAAAAIVSVRFLNAPGEQFGLASGTIAVGDLIYTAAAGKVSVVSTGGALLCGRATCAGYDGGVVTYVPIQAAA